MKTIAIFLFLATTHFCFAQDPELIDNEWYLQNVIIDGNDNPPPSNDEVSDVIAEFFVDSFGTLVCNNLVGFVAYNIQNFNFTKPLEQTLLPCNMQVNQDFEILYFGFYYSDQADPFAYSITTEGNGTKTLTITSASGDQAIYGNELLTSQDFSGSIFSLYPNPVKDELNLKSLSNDAEKLEIKIYDLTGKLLISTITDTDTSLNVASLKQGVYFVVVENGESLVEVKKFIKK